MFDNKTPQERYTVVNEFLRNHSTAVITFTKKDGTERVMNCTTNPVVVPKVEIKEGATPRKQSETTMRVFDTDIKEWRSFTTKSIKQINVTLGV